MWLPVVLLAVFFYQGAGFAQTALANRHALVIGNSRYASLTALPGSLENARLMAATLERAGFTVKRIENAGNDDLFRAEREFVAGIQPDDVCFVYYSGYAAAVPDDDDYLLPVDFKPTAETDLEERAFRLNRILQDLDRKKAALKIAMIEGPYKIDAPVRGGPNETLDDLGLYKPDVTRISGTVIAFGAHHGQFISPARAGLFTRTVAERIDQHGLTVEAVFEQTQQQVGQQSKLDQLPDWTLSVIPRFYFHDPDPVTPTTEIKEVKELVNIAPQNPRDREEYVLIPAGAFKMGCVPGDKRCKAEEKPQHEVTISHPFWLGRNEVRVVSYRRFVEASRGKYKMPSAPRVYNSGWNETNYPMIMVSWAEAGAYCGWAGGRLPTEAEWEYAARAGKNDEIYPLNSENSRDKANFYGKKGNDIFDQLATVRSFDENAYHLFDMAGNVWEWVADWWSPSYYAASDKADPTGPATGKQHVERGGSFESDWEEHLRLSFRQPESGANFKTGFRCALDDTPETKKLLKSQ
jgi:sulfatase modifying factor 1